MAGTHGFILTSRRVISRMSILIEYVRDMAEMVQESAEGAHDFESVGDVPVEHREETQRRTRIDRHRKAP